MNLRDTLVMSAIAGALCAAPANAGGCVGDLNGDSTVDGADLGLMLNAWGQAGGAADLDGSGTIDGADLGILLSGWGDCPVVVITAVHPDTGGPGTLVAIEGNFPTDDPFDACVVLVGKGQGEQAGIFAPIEIEKLAVGPGGQVLFGQIGPVPDWFAGEVELMVVWGSGFPTEIPNPFEPLITITDEGACWGDPQPGGANIIFNVGGGLSGFGACGPGFDASHVGTIQGGNLCVTLPGGPGPSRTYPSGTKFEVWPRFHTCDGQYVKDCGTVRFTLNAPLTPLTVAGVIETLLQLEINNCGPSNGLLPQVAATPLGNNLYRICISLPGHPVCAGNLVICVDLP